MRPPWHSLADPEAFPRNGILASRVALALPDDARPAFTKAVFRYEFCEGRDIADPEVVADAVRQTGFELEPAVTAAQTDLVKHALRKQTDQALASQRAFPEAANRPRGCPYIGDGEPVRAVIIARPVIEFQTALHHRHRAAYSPWLSMAPIPSLVLSMFFDQV